ncbi:MAG: argS, partial [Blastococcus sp.]|nr:argS [Blastococcus sp.]
MLGSGAAHPVRFPSLGRAPRQTPGPGRARGAVNPGQYARAVTPEQLQDVVATDVRAVVDRGALPVEVPADVVIERPRNPEHGDYATNVALRLAKAAGRPPREVADVLAEELGGHDG